MAKDKLSREILSLNYPDGSVTSLLEKWVDQGVRLRWNELQSLSAELMNSGRYSDCLQIMEYLESESRFRMSPEDHGVKTGLLAEVRGIEEAEEFYENMLRCRRGYSFASVKASSLPLLRGYVEALDTERAESHMERMKSSKMASNAEPYNEIMKLYVNTLAFEKVGLVVAEMRRARVPLDGLSYDLWMRSCLESSSDGVWSVEMAYKAMTRDRGNGVEVRWSSLSTLARAYARAGRVERASVALRAAERKLRSGSSHHCRLAYSELMAQHASLGDKDAVLRLWGSSRALGGSYKPVISCLVEMGELEEAERLFREWEAGPGRKSGDARVSNVLLRAYARNGAMERAEALHLRALERGVRPNFSTWRILAEGWVRSGDMEKGIAALMIASNAFGDRPWRPSPEVATAVSEHYESRGDFEAARQFVRTAHDFGFASLALYKSSLRIHRSFREPAREILEMMERDEIELDDEARALVEICRQEPKEELWFRH